MGNKKPQPAGSARSEAFLRQIGKIIRKQQRKQQRKRQGK